MRIHDRALLAPTRKRATEPPSGPEPASATTQAGLATDRPVPSGNAFLCERCHAAMFRMHAVWRCPSCGFKTDCCGW